jgi:hypothetical protein
MHDLNEPNAIEQLARRVRALEATRFTPEGIRIYLEADRWYDSSGSPSRVGIGGFAESPVAWAFDSGISEGAGAQFVMPHLDTTKSLPITTKIYWAHSTAVAGNVVVRFEHKIVRPDATLSGAITQTDDVVALSGVHPRLQIHQMSVIMNAYGQDLVLMALYRYGNHLSDTASFDWWFIGAEFIIGDQ